MLLVSASKGGAIFHHSDPPNLRPPCTETSWETCLKGCPATINFGRHEARDERHVCAQIRSEECWAGRIDILHRAFGYASTDFSPQASSRFLPRQPKISPNARPADRNPKNNVMLRDTRVWSAQKVGLSWSSSPESRPRKQEKWTPKRQTAWSTRVSTWFLTASWIDLDPSPRPDRCAAELIRVQQRNRGIYQPLYRVYFLPTN